MVLAVANVKKKDFEGATQLQKLKTEREERMEGISGGYISWTELVTQKGEENARAIADGKTVPMKRDPDLPKDAKIDFPKDQLFKIARQVCQSEERIFPKPEFQTMCMFRQRFHTRTRPRQT